MSPPRSAEASSGDRGQSPQPSDDVVVGDDHAERRMADDDRQQAEVDVERLNVVLKAIPVTTPGSAIGRTSRK